MFNSKGGMPMNDPKLCQVIAIEKGVKSREQKKITELHRLSDNPGLFTGLVKTFSPRFEEGHENHVRLPDERQRVQARVEDVLDEAGAVLSELFDIEATKDFGNTAAKANVVVDGNVLVEGAPTTYLLFLEKQLNDIYTFIGKLPELDEAFEWETDPSTGLRRTNPFETVKTKKVQKALVLYDATPEHPAQTQLVSEDEVVGTWQTTRLSGAISAIHKRDLLNRVVNLQKAVKIAREEANSQTVQRQKVGRLIVDYLFSE
jgi:hypothetical protein